MQRRYIVGAVLLLAATAGVQWAGAADQVPGPRGERATGAVVPAAAALSWGEDSNGQLGNGSPSSNQDAPRAVSGLTNVVELAAGALHSLALLNDGTVMSWGRDNEGQLGNGAPAASQAAPVAVSGLSGVEAIAGGGFHSLALLDDGTVMSWGRDNEGQLGNGPPAASQPAPVAVSHLGGVEAIAAGSSHSLALLSDGRVMSWGDDSHGQLGNDEDTRDQAVPRVVSRLSGVEAIAAGAWHSLALLNDGRVMSWGDDFYGQLGTDATTGEQPVPVEVSGLSGVEAIAAGPFHSLALLNDGTVMSWGRDISGQLGNGAPFANQDAPVEVSGLSGVEAIAAGFGHSLALLNDGTVRAWGDDVSGQLGNGATTGEQPAPVEVSGLRVVAAISAGSFHSLAIGPTCLGQPATQAGSAAGEALSGTAAVDIIDGGGGNDTIDGFGGHDIICGGPGDDTLRGGGGGDKLLGGAGVDTIGGQSGSGDNCLGGAGRDRFLGGSEAASGCETATSIP
ncbi:MAG: hypothetical protein WEB00_01590 [Dehalococcoidia bacterium]